MPTDFPNLSQGDYNKTSDPTPEYNCIAWAAGETDVWWWPHVDSYWPPSVPRQNNLSAFILAFELLGYKQCNNSALENGYEKIALYVDTNGIPTHAARQLPSGHWTSKLGQHIDIEHISLGVLTGGVYGNVATIMKRPLAAIE